MKDILKKNLTILAQGIMFGFGFGIAAWVLYFAFQTKTPEPSIDRAEEAASIPGAAKSHQFAFRNVEEIQRNGRTHFIGMVKNNGTTPGRGLSIEVNLFLKEKFVDQYSSYISGELGPSEERYFKIACGCKGEPPAEHDNYKIGVVGGY